MRLTTIAFAAPVSEPVAVTPDDAQGTVRAATVDNGVLDVEVSPQPLPLQHAFDRLLQKIGLVVRGVTTRMTGRFGITFFIGVPSPTKNAVEA